MMRLLITIVTMTLIMSCGNKKTDTPATADTTSSNAQSAAVGEGVPMLIGTYTRKEGHVDGKAEGIHLAYLKDGKVTYNKSIPAGINPSYIALHPQKPFVYAANETGSADKGETTGSITALSYDENFNFQELNSRPTYGTHTCHINISKHGNYAMTADYSGGSIAMFPIALDGKMGGAGYNKLSFSGKGPHDRQESSHLHFIAEGPGDLIYTADLGTDSIRVFNTTNGILTPHKHQIVVASGAGPRHIVFHPDRPLIYIVNELNATIEAWRYEGDAPFRKLQTIGTLPEGKKEGGLCAAIKMSADGRHLYVSNRGEVNNIAIYNVKLDGVLVLVGHESTQGKTPRDFAISPDGKYLVVANQDSDDMITFEIDPVNGALSNGKMTKNIPSPVCIKFL